MDIKSQKSKQKTLKSTFFVILIILTALCLPQSAKADFATPFVEMNNQVGDVSEAHGYVAAGGSDVENCTDYLVIVTTDTMGHVVIRATAEKGVVKESMLGRWVIIKAEVTSRTIDPATKRNSVKLKILSVKSADEKVSTTIDKQSLEKLKAKYPETLEFINSLGRGPISYKSTKQKVTKEQLPLLYGLLDDKEYASHWHGIARIIGYVSERNDSESIAVLLNYFQRDDDKIESLVGKIWSIAMIGQIGGDAAYDILKKAVTKQGAEELAKNWIDKKSWNDTNHDKEFVIEYTQNAAMQGLAYTQTAENDKLLEDLYTKEMELFNKQQKTTDMMGYIIDAMSKKDFIKDNSLEAYLGLEEHEMFNKLGPYIMRYTPMPPGFLN